MSEPMVIAPGIIPRRRVVLRCEGQGRAHQEFKEECDINVIVSKWRRTHSVTHLKQGMPWYGDFTTASDYQDAMNRCLSANEAFLDLPASVRDRCGNSPSKFMSMIADEEGLEALEEAGLKVDRRDPPPVEKVASKPPEEPVKAPVEESSG